MARDQSIIDSAWLNLVQEAPIDPDVPCIDPQHHVWQSKRGFPYMLQDLAADVTAGHNIVATVFVGSGSHYRTDGPGHLRCVGETEWIQRHAEDYARRNPDGPALCTALVPHLDFRHDPAEVDEALAAHKAASPRVRGIRQSATWSDDPVVNLGRPPAQRHVYLDPVFRKGLSRLARQGLTFDAYIFHDQMPELVDLARALPDTTIICNHMCAPLGQGGWASRRGEVLRDWQKGIRDLAALPNVHMKLGGVAMPMFGFGWQARPRPPTSDEMVAAAGQFYEYTIDAFSPARCMFESNFPVDKLGCAYVPLWNSFKKVAARYSASERAALLCETARRLYRIDAQVRA